MGLIERVAEYGILLVFVNVLLEQLGLPIPALPTLIVAGALAARGTLSATLVLAVAVFASVIADYLWYELGRYQGYRVLKTLCRVSLSPDSCVQQTESFYQRYGLASLLFAKFVPGFSTVAPPLAGATRAPIPAFLAWDAGGALLWAGSGVLLGAIFHRAIDRVLDALASIGSGALVLVGVGSFFSSPGSTFSGAASITPSAWPGSRRWISPGDRTGRSSRDRGRAVVRGEAGRSSPDPGRAIARARWYRSGARGPAAGSRDHPLLHLTQRGLGGPCGPRADRSGVQEGEAARRGAGRLGHGRLRDRAGYRGDPPRLEPPSGISTPASSA
jgi:membrane protein DedA with SNARE-associated domain